MYEEIYAPSIQGSLAVFWVTTHGWCYIKIFPFSLCSISETSYELLMHSQYKWSTYTFLYYLCICVPLMFLQFMSHFSDCHEISVWLSSILEKQRVTEVVSTYHWLRSFSWYVVLSVAIDFAIIMQKRHVIFRLLLVLLNFFYWHPFTNSVSEEVYRLFGDTNAQARLSDIKAILNTEKICIQSTLIHAQSVGSER